MHGVLFPEVDGVVGVLDALESTQLWYTVLKLDFFVVQSALYGSELRTCWSANTTPDDASWKDLVECLEDNKSVLQVLDLV